MKVIGNIDEVMALDSQLASFIIETCAWVAEDWDPARLGFIYVLNDDDIDIVKSVCIVPQELCAGDEDYQAAMTIDLETFDLWEPPALFDQRSKYWNSTMVVGQEYGGTLLFSSGFVASLPALQAKKGVASLLDSSPVGSPVNISLEKSNYSLQVKIMELKPNQAAIIVEQRRILTPNSAIVDPHRETITFPPNLLHPSQKGFKG